MRDERTPGPGRKGKLDPNHQLPADIKALQDPNFTRDDFLRALNKVTSAKRKPKQ